MPIRYLPRTFAEGKKIRAKDGLLALGAMFHWFLIDDLYEHDEYGTRLISELGRRADFTLWLGDTIRPFVGDQILELGSGVGSIANQFIPRDLYVAAEVNPNYLTYLRSYPSANHTCMSWTSMPPSPKASRARRPIRYGDRPERLKNLEDPIATLRAAYSTLSPGGRIILQVPQGKKRFGTLDQERGRRTRFEADEVRKMMEEAGFRVEHIADFNRMSVQDGCSTANCWGESIFPGAVEGSRYGSSAHARNRRTCGRGKA